MVTKIGQRRFLLKLGYTNEQLDRMSPSTAHGIISDVEKTRDKERQAIRETEEEKVRKQQFKEEVQEAIEEILDQTRKEAIKEFAERLKDRWSYRDRQKTVTLDDINETLEEFGERE